ncbi:MAG: tripartite tricarboxylate transporter substrate binding protein, partial [Bradyrhizobium sp.]|nr:tripartite tricarboxylate transporter substrate binding protein [Bradyrhizobium sp.]
FFPARTPSAIVNTMNEAVRTAMKDPAVIDALDKVSYEPRDMTPEKFAKVVRDEVALWDDIVRKTKAKLQ